VFVGSLTLSVEDTMPCTRRSSPSPRRPAIHAVLLAVALLAACATTTPRPGGSLRPRGASDPITRVEAAGTNATTAADLVRTLRANWLASRGPTTFSQPDGGSMPVVFVDGMRVGPLGELRFISVGEVEEIRFLGASEATFRYGSGYASGIIHVMTRR
jgi:hypothetical protein